MLDIDAGWYRCLFDGSASTDQRKELLGLLLTLMKKPDSEQRSAITDALYRIAQNLKPSAPIADLVADWWQNVDSPYHERRALLADCCGVLAQFGAAAERESTAQPWPP